MYSKTLRLYTGDPMWEGMLLGKSLIPATDEETESDLNVYMSFGWRDFWTCVGPSLAAEEEV